ncbi:MAG: glycosyltransferase [Patescibacteria group bacterium]
MMKKTNIKISIIIPCFNDGQYLTEAIKSTEKIDPNLAEIIIIDDGSTEKRTLGILNNLKQSNYLVFSKKNNGLSAARNFGISKAKGEYILPLDADNTIEPEYISAGLEILEQNKNIDVVYSDCQKFGLCDLEVQIPDFDIKKILEGNYIDACTIFRKSLWQKCGGYDENIKKGGEDWEFWINAYKNRARFYHLSKPLFSYRIRRDSLITKMKKEEKTKDLVNYIYAKHADIVAKILKAEKQQKIQKKSFGLDKIQKTLLVIRSYPKFIIRDPKLLKRFFKILFRHGLYASFQNAYDLLQLNQLQKFDLIASPQNIEIASNNYHYWVLKNNQLSKKRVEADKNIFKSLKYQPKISIIVPVHQVPLKILELTLKSVSQQYYPNWELCIANSNQKDKITKFLNNCGQKDKRIKIKNLEANLGIAQNSNAALSLATGDFIALLDHDDELNPDALLEVINQLQKNPGADIIYSDEDIINFNIQYCRPFFKPDWSPDLLLSMNYISHLTVYRKKIIDQLGGFRKDFDGSQDYDLILRATKITKNIYHLPKVLYHWRMSSESMAFNEEVKPYCYSSARKALEQAITQKEIKANLMNNPFPPYYVRYQLARQYLVSIIIPTKDQPDLLLKCVESIIQKTNYQNYEIIIINNNSKETKTKTVFESLVRSYEQLRIINYNKEFNYSAINNFGANQAKGDVLLFLNDDTEVIDQDWLLALLEQAQRPTIGAVGGKLIYPNGLIQHAGIVLQKNLLAIHAFRLWPDGQTYFNLGEAIRDCSAVTGACLMIRKNLFNSVGGFDQSYQIIYSDVDLCLKLRQQGYLIVYTPLAKLYHFESATRGLDIYPQDKKQFLEKWQTVLDQGDPYYNPNLKEY